MSLLDFLVGPPIATWKEGSEKIGVAKGIPVFGLDALGSAAYGPEAALTLLIPLGLAGLNHILPLTFGIIALLGIVFFSYRQTIAAYPGGGGSYTVARENLGTFPGLLAACALLIDYTLDAAVGISAGIGALTSAIPSLHPQTLWLCLSALLILTLVNLRGVRENGALFMVPTYLFLVCMLVAIGIGVAKTALADGHPVPVVAPPSAPAVVAAVSAWLLLKSFASGCTALTGVEAVSNGVQAFRDDRTKNARHTLAVIIAALMIMLAGIAYLVKAYKIVATDPNGSHYRSILSMLLGAVTGHGWFYYLSIGSILLILIFSANTAFADFPRVCHFIAEDGYLPVSFADRGRRLVYSEGILVLATITGLLLIGFGGITDRLIPLFAVGAFLAFTMSQAGMVFHWRRERGRGARRSMLINAVGAVSTGITTLIIIVAKFSEGAWITVLAIPSLLLLMYGVRRHYNKLIREIAVHTPLPEHRDPAPLMVVTLTGWSRVGKEALRTAMTLSDEVKVVHVIEDRNDKVRSPDEVCDRWTELVEKPAREGNLPVPELVVLKSPYRFVVTPIVNYILKLSKENPDRRVITVIPELMERRWYYYFLHTQRASLLKARLLMVGTDRISVLNIPWYLKHS
ncbi:MAG: APC family permease [Acidobacteriaceae bacterium]|nr:APC family permease [Acidobacteriaceae bacterium]MBV9502470.1 APC family permease [Acidobacteriaceae bacterium]